MRKHFQLIRLILFIAGFGLIGIIVHVATQAATIAVNAEAEDGSRSGTLCTTNDGTASSSAAVAFGVTNCSSSGLTGLARIPWEGGPQYWSGFSKASAGGWTSPNFFPIAVFYGKASTEYVTAYKDAGINLIAPVEHDPTTFPLTNISNAGVFAAPGSIEWTANEVGNNAKSVGWFVSDECEMNYGNCPGAQSGDGTETAGFQLQQTEANRLRNLNDGRFLMSNFGNGILRTFWAGTTMDRHVQLMDTSSADKYTYTSPDVGAIIDGVHDAPDWPNGVPVARAYSYGWQADQMRRFQNQSALRPVWTFVETAKPYVTEQGAKSITAAQMEGAVWSALIHEARGIYYFDHNNETAGSCTSDYSIVNCATVHATVKAVNAQIMALAPVLNSQSYYNATEVRNGFTYYRYSFNNGTDTMLKAYGGYAYIFAGLGLHCSNTGCTSGSADATGSKTFTLPAGVSGTSVEVIGEGRTLPVTAGKFTDTFASEYTHHSYKILL